ncbi:MAG: hypothetical protein WCT33_01980 [Patescibacteria group bacterium]
MKFDEPPKPEGFSKYQMDIMHEIEHGRASSVEEAVKIVELAMFEQRIEQFSEDDLKRDADGSWHTFEQKIKAVFPELPEDRQRAMKAAVTMHLCGM